MCSLAYTARGGEGTVHSSPSCPLAPVPPRSLTSKDARGVEGPRGLVAAQPIAQQRLTICKAPLATRLLIFATNNLVDEKASLPSNILRATLEDVRCPARNPQP